MAVDGKGIFEALESHALRLGVFGAVNGHEPKSPPVYGDSLVLTLALGPFRPITSSGLQSLSYRIEVLGRIWKTNSSETDATEPEILSAAITFMSSISGGFTLGGLIRCVDVLGMDGEQMQAEPGYVDMGDDKYRTIDLMIPLLVNDVMTLGA